MAPASSAHNEALAAFPDAVALWYVDQIAAADVVLAACDLLASGVDGSAVRELAAVELARADIEVHAILEAVLDELGLPNHPRGSEAAQRIAFSAMAARVLSSSITPRDFAAWAHEQFGHESFDEADDLANMQDRYEYNEHTGEPCDDLDAEVIALARQVTHSRPSS